MLAALSVKRCRLMTNNPEKVKALQAFGLQVDEVIPTGIFVTAHNRNYLLAKAQKKNHAIKLDLPV